MNADRVIELAAKSHDELALLAAAWEQDAKRWREIEQQFVHERCGPNIGWTIGDLVLQGDTPADAVDRAIEIRENE